MRVAMIGTGYVGLVSGVCLAAKGHDVTCIDIDEAKVARINAGDPPIHEDGLEPLLKEVTGSGALRASTDLEAAIRESEISLIAVGTPFDGSAIDLNQIKGVARQIGEALKIADGWRMVVVKSTVVPGTTEDVVLPILEEASGKAAGEGFGVGMNPEFLKEGDAVVDFMNPDRIVLGGIDERSIDALAELYAPFADAETVRTNPRTAGMIKYAANSLLATLISFSNEVGNLCAKVGVDVTEALAGVHLDKRFSPIMEDNSRVRPASLTYLEAGCGFGGSCFPKDVKALVAHGEAVGVPMPVLAATLDINAAQPMKMIDLLKRDLPDLEGKRIAVLGVAFKPGTDDIRESPALPILSYLIDAKADIVAFDPIAAEEGKAEFPTGVAFADTLDAAIDGAEAVLLVTRWPEFDALPEMLKSQANPPLLVDGRRMIAKDAVPRYAGIGLS